MKNLLVRILSVLSLLSFVFLTGCATTVTPPTAASANDAARLTTVVVTPGVDGVAVTAAVLDTIDIDPITGKNLVPKKGTNGEKDVGWKRSVHLYSSMPLGGELLKGVLGGTGAALIQREAAKEVAEINATCGGKGCSATPPIVVNSFSQSQSNSSTNSTIGTCGAACAQ